MESTTPPSARESPEPEPLVARHHPCRFAPWPKVIALSSALATLSRRPETADRNGDRGVKAAMKGDIDVSRTSRGATSCGSADFGLNMSITGAAPPASFKPNGTTSGDCCLPKFLFQAPDSRPEVGLRQLNRR